MRSRFAKDVLEAESCLARGYPDLPAETPDELLAPESVKVREDMKTIRHALLSGLRPCTCILCSVNRAIGAKAPHD